MASRMRRCVAALQNAAGSSSSFGLAPLQAHGARNNFSARLKFSKRRTGQIMRYINRTS